MITTGPREGPGLTNSSIAHALKAGRLWTSRTALFSMKLVLIEDSEVIRRQMVRLLADVSGLSVIGQADNEEAALTLIRSTVPDVVLVDIGLAEGSGMKVLERARQIGYGGKLFVLSNRDPDFYEMLCARHGADAFYDKAHGLDRLVADLQAIADGIKGV